MIAPSRESRVESPEPEASALPSTLDPQPSTPSPRLLLFRGHGMISSLIRWQTRSEYSHAALLLYDGATIIEAWQGAGVRKAQVTNWENIDKFEVISPVNWPLALAFAERQIGKGYDYLQVLRFVSRRGGKLDYKWFCSELVFAAILAGGVRLLRTEEPWRISPGHLALSPLLEPV